ncbi:hypothetical protein [Roseicella frigidaeris]|nr:hypothetical protein [Roseicella frigidaeris]
MSRISLAAGLLLGLAAAPALAQGSDALPGTLTSRTLQQNQRAFLPAPPTTQVVQGAKPAVAKDRQAQSGPAARPGRRVVLAERSAR